MSVKKIAFFASGAGSNIENIVRYFRQKETATAYLIFCNKPDAYVLKRAESLKIETIIFDKADLKDSTGVLDKLNDFEPDLIVLAGFLWLMPENIILRFPGKIINIHPALLPRHGGKGMYGMNVHHAVIADKDPQSGITIHYVNKHYDEGAYILQVACEVGPTDTAEDIAEKVHQLEYKHFPEVIDRILNQ